MRSVTQPTGCSGSDRRQRVCAPNFLFAVPAWDGSVRPRPWKNASYDEGEALWFAAMTVETPVDRLTRAV